MPRKPNRYYLERLENDLTGKYVYDGNKWTRIESIKLQVYDKYIEIKNILYKDRNDKDYVLMMLDDTKYPALGIIYNSPFCILVRRKNGVLEPRGKYVDIIILNDSNVYSRLDAIREHYDKKGEHKNGRRKSRNNSPKIRSSNG